MPDKVEVESSRYMAQRGKKLLMATFRIEHWSDEGMADDIRVLRLDIATPARTGDQWRATIKGRDGKGGLWVAWAFGDTAEDLLVNMAERGEVQGFKWREDHPYDPNAKK